MIKKEIIHGSFFGDFSGRYQRLMDKDSYNQLMIMSTGGGISLSDILLVPGSSQRIASILHPYSMDELWDLVSPVVKKNNPKFTKDDWHSVNADSARIYLESISLSRKKDYHYVACTAALETNRKRKGKNVAYVATRKSKNSPIMVWEILLKKIRSKYTNKQLEDFGYLSWIRQEQDEKISFCICQIILGDRGFFNCLEKGEKITLLSCGVSPFNEIWLEGK